MKTSKIINKTKTELSGIPCLYFKPTFIEGKLPTIIFYHGWHSSKENNEFLAAILAQNGYGVLVPDSVFHGERNPIDYDVPGVLEQYFWEIVINSVQESDFLIKEAAEKLDIDPDRIAVSGSSMGGFISSGIFASNSNIKCLVCINGASAWEKAENTFIEYDGHGLAGDLQLQEIIKYDPVRFKDTLYPRPILLLHGDIDSQIPIVIQRYFYDEVSKTYKNDPEKIKLIEYPGINHQKTLSMIEDIVDWLDKYL